MLKKCALFLLYCYRWFISPYLKPECRFTPSCSCYAIDAIQNHGFLKGLNLTIRRLIKCQPFSKAAPYQGTYDPVPIKKEK